MTVLGVDAYKPGWVAVALDDAGFVGAFVGAFVGPDIAAIEAEASERWGVEVFVAAMAWTARELRRAFPYAGPDRG
jgi:hypothetical protein